MREQRRVFAVVLLVPAVVDLRRLRRHRRIDYHRQHWNAFLILEFADHVQYLLCATNGKCGDQDRPAALGRLIDDAGHLRFRVDVAMQPVPVCRFAHQVIARRRRRRIMQDRLVVMPEIAGEQKANIRTIRPRVRHLDKNETRAHNVPRHAESGREALAYIVELAVIRERAQQL